MLVINTFMLCHTVDLSHFEMLNYLNGYVFEKYLWSLTSAKIIIRSLLNGPFKGGMKESEMSHQNALGLYLAYSLQY